MHDPHYLMSLHYVFPQNTTRISRLCAYPMYQLLLCIQMGNSEDWVSVASHFKSEQELLSSLIPIDDGENTNEMLALGRFKIYRFRSEPYELLMKHVRTFTPDNPRCLEYSAMARVLASRIDHKNVARIHSLNICTRSSLCIKQTSIESYVNYYALDLEQVVSQRRSSDWRFAPGEVWYLVNSLLELAVYLQKCEVSFGVFLPRNIFLSPEGYIKVYLYHLHPQQKHLLYYHLIASDCRQAYRYLPIAPQCLGLLRLRAQELRGVSLQKMDVFGIGMVALQAMLFSSTRRYYANQSSNEHALSFDQKLLRKDFKQLREVYPHALTNLLERMVAPEPEERISLAEAKEYIRGIREQISISGSIRLIEDQQHPIPNKLSYKSTRDESTAILQSITNNINGESRLNFVPLRPISKEKSNCTTSQCKSLTASQLGLSIAQRKENRLNLSNLTGLQSVSRRKESRGRGAEQKYMSSYR